MTDYLGKCACYYTIGKFLSLSKEEWIRKMEKGSGKTTEYEITSQQIRAWEDCYDVLHKSLAELPEDYKKLHIIFEYVLPGNKTKGSEPDPDYQIRADAIILSRKTACVLELKQREDLFYGHVRAARKYRKSIQNYHVESRGMNKKAILLLTKADGLIKNEYKVNVCSPDKLAQTIISCFEANHVSRSGAEAQKWIESEFKVRSPKTAAE